MRIGLDTTVVLRLLLGEPTAQAALAHRRLEQAVAAEGSIIVSDLVVAEAYYALCHHYGMPKGEAQALLRAMLHSGVVELHPQTSLDALEPAKGAGLVDRLLVGRYRSMDASTWTFDRKLGALDGAERLRAERPRSR